MVEELLDCPRIQSLFEKEGYADALRKAVSPNLFEKITSFNRSYLQSKQQQRAPLEEEKSESSQSKGTAPVASQVYKHDWLKRAREIFSELECPENIEQLSHNELVEYTEKANDLALVKFCRRLCKLPLLPEDVPYSQVASDLRRRIQDGEITPADFKPLTAAKIHAIPLEIISLGWKTEDAVPLLDQACLIGQPIEPFRSLSSYNIGNPQLILMRDRPNFPNLSLMLYRAVLSGNLENIQSLRTWPGREYLGLDFFWEAISYAFRSDNYAFMNKDVKNGAYRSDQLSIFQELKKWPDYQTLPFGKIEQVGWSSIKCVGLIFLLEDAFSAKKEMVEELFNCPRVQSLLQNPEQIGSLFKRILEKASYSKAREGLRFYQAVAAVPNRALLSASQYGKLLYSFFDKSLIFDELSTWPELDLLNGTELESLKNSLSNKSNRDSFIPKLERLIQQRKSKAAAAQE